MLRMHYTKFRKKITFQKHGIPFLKWPLMALVSVNPPLLSRLILAHS